MARDVFEINFSFLVIIGKKRSKKVEKLYITKKKKIFIKYL